MMNGALFKLARHPVYVPVRMLEIYPDKFLRPINEAKQNMQCFEITINVKVGEVRRSK